MSSSGTGRRATVSVEEIFWEQLVSTARLELEDSYGQLAARVDDGRGGSLSLHDMGAGNEVEAGSGKFWWRAEMLFTEGGAALPRNARWNWAHFYRELRSDSFLTRQACRAISPGTQLSWKG
jgi:hypothetical protein